MDEWMEEGMELVVWGLVRTKDTGVYIQLGQWINMNK